MRKASGLTPSLTPPNTKMAVAHSRLPCMMLYPRKGQAMIRATVKAFGMVYGDSCSSSSSGASVFWGDRY